MKIHFGGLFGPSSFESTPVPQWHEEIPWHTEADVTLAMARIGNYLEQHAGAFHSRARRCRDLSARFENDAWVWENVARVALGMKPLD